MTTNTRTDAPQTLAQQLNRVSNAIDKAIVSVITDELDAGAVIKPRRAR